MKATGWPWMAPHGRGCWWRFCRSRTGNVRVSGVLRAVVAQPGAVGCAL